MLGPSRLKIRSELSQAWVRFVLGPKNTKGPSCLGSELSGYHKASVVKNVAGIKLQSETQEIGGYVVIFVPKFHRMSVGDIEK